MQTNTAMDYDFSQRFRLGRRTFYLAADDIRSLKHRIDVLAAAADAAAGDSATAPRVRTSLSHSIQNVRPRLDLTYPFGLAFLLKSPPAFLK